MVHFLSRTLVALAAISLPAAFALTNQECVDFFGSKLNECTTDLSSVHFNLVWVVDGSGSVGSENYKKQVAFLEEMSYYANECFTIGFNKAMVFSSYVTPYDYPYSLPYPRGYTNTPLALLDTKSELGSRSTEINIVLLLTDGVPNCALPKNSDSYSCSSSKVNVKHASEQSRAAALALLNLGSNTWMTYFPITNGADETLFKQSASIASHPRYEQTKIIGSFDEFLQPATKEIITNIVVSQACTASPSSFSSSSPSSSPSSLPSSSPSRSPSNSPSSSPSSLPSSSPSSSPSNSPSLSPSSLPSSSPSSSPSNSPSSSPSSLPSSSPSSSPSNSPSSSPSSLPSSSPSSSPSNSPSSSPSSLPSSSPSSFPSSSPSSSLSSLPSSAPSSSPSASPSSSPSSSLSMSPTTSIDIPCGCTTATIHLHCDNRLDFNYQGTSYSEDNWKTAFHHSLEFNSSTEFEFSCKDFGVIGGFVATMDICGYKVSTYANSNYSQPNSFQFYLKEAHMNQDAVEYSVDELFFKPFQESPWRISDNRLESDAMMVWDDRTYNTMVFGFNFFEFGSVCKSEAPTNNPTPPPSASPPSPPECKDGIQYYPHPIVCSQFYKCSNGIPYLFDCPSGLNFDSALNVCDWPENVICFGNSSSPLLN